MTTRYAAPGSPIYDQLVQEHGDVLGEARKLADLTHRQADRLLGPSTDASAPGGEYPEQS
ncbi:hypothetical protein [Streptomyces sp. SP18CS02]|uniref:hypothetical protein n=1 Tax=Streptomyces sp. SP18CS02 TaxID=3002531 RepID=UPI002E77F943|nr:hypothetical protein [Streptomyces sp. SP18CS02]MEE1756628.1 hypothetical protein [Streptomyces sp. SP18CS02]